MRHALSRSSLCGSTRLKLQAGWDENLGHRSVTMARQHERQAARDEMQADPHFSPRSSAAVRPPIGHAIRQRSARRKQQYHPTVSEQITQRVPLLTQPVKPH